MNKYKTFEELKEELGDKFEEYMYKANIELLNKLDKIKEYINRTEINSVGKPLAYTEIGKELLELLEEIE
jgi:hypothetical protein